MFTPQGQWLPRNASLLLVTIAAALIFSTPAAASLTSTNPVVLGTQNPVTFVQFNLNTAPGDFIITDNGSSDTLTVTSQLLDFFSFANIANLPADVAHGQVATLNLSLTTTTHATNVGGSLSEGGFSGSFSIIRNTPASNGQSNLLSGTLGGGLLTGSSGAASATFSDSTTFGGTIALTSSFISLSNALQEDFSISLTGMPVAFTIGLGNFISNDVANGAGTLDSNPVPQALPEPTSMFLMGAGLLPLAWFAKRKRSPERAPRIGVTQPLVRSAIWYYN